MTVTGDRFSVYSDGMKSYKLWMMNDDDDDDEELKTRKDIHWIICTIEQ